MSSLWKFSALIFILVFIYLLLRVGAHTIAHQNVNASPEAATPCKVVYRTRETRVNCSYLGLTDFNRTAFPQNATIILLNNNLLTAVTNDTFQGFSRLQVLDLSTNVLSSIEAHAFVGLELLEILYLQYNRLNLMSLAITVFCPLTSLIQLRINQEYLESTPKHSNMEQRVRQPRGCPPNIFSCLRSLTTLSVDPPGETLHFDESFRSMINVTTLYVQGAVDVVTNSSFENIRGVTSFHMNFDANTGTFDKNALAVFEHLDNLSMKYVSVGLHYALELLKPLRGSNMTSILFWEVIISQTDKSLSIITGDGILTENVTAHLTAICVRKVSLARNEIYVISFRALSSNIWDRCLEEIILTSNPILSTTYLLDTFKLSNLRLIVISSFWYNYAKLYDINDSVTPLHRSYNTSEVKSFYKEMKGLRSISVDDGTSPLRTNVADISFLNALAEYNEIKTNDAPSLETVTISDSIRYVDMSYYFKSISVEHNIIFNNAFNLEYLDFSYNNGFDFFGVISGLTGVKTLLLTGNNLFQIANTFFDSFPAIEELHLSNCNLDVVFMFQNCRRLFKGLKNLTSLDLSYNSLTVIAPDSFADNEKLSILNLEGNQFKYFPFDLRNTPHLLFLNLGINSLTSLPQNVMQWLDSRADMSENFILYLHDNILNCACSNRPFLQWLTSSHVTFDEGGNFTCLGENYDFSYTAAFANAEIVWRQCSGQSFFYVSVVIYFVVFIGYLIMFIYNKKRTWIISFIWEIIFGYPYPKSSHYENGVFVLLPDTLKAVECQIVKNVLIPYIHALGLQTKVYESHMNGGNDDTLGNTDINVICDGIASSWRVAAILSGDFMQDNWLPYAVNTTISARLLGNTAQLVLLVPEAERDNVPVQWIAALEEDNLVILPNYELDYKMKETLKKVLC